MSSITYFLVIKDVMRAWNFTIPCATLHELEETHKRYIHDTDYEVVEVLVQTSFITCFPNVKKYIEERKDIESTQN